MCKFSIKKSSLHIINSIPIIQIEDCTKALELLQPAVSLNLHARKQCLARRGAALCKIGINKLFLIEFNLYTWKSILRVFEVRL